MMNHNEIIKPYLSIIIPTYNRYESLNYVIDALLGQDKVRYTDFEIIIVDDGSREDISQRLASLATEYPAKIVYLRQSKRGPGAARNLGIRHALGEIVLLIGDDIIGRPDFLYQHIHCHRSLFPEDHVAILGYSPMVHMDCNKSSFIQEWLNRKQTAYQNLSHMSDATYHYFYTCNISLKKAFVTSHGGFNELYQYAAGEDTELGYRLSRNRLRIVYNQEAVGYHVHEISVLQLIKRYFNNGRSARISIGIESPMPDTWISTRSKLSPFRGLKLGQLTIFALLYVVSATAFLLGYFADEDVQKASRAR